MAAQTVVLGLGGNIGDVRTTLRAAIELVEQSIATPLTVSGLYRTPALLPPDAPTEWDIPFLNMAVAGPCVLSPQALLEKCQHIEMLLGRQSRGRWGPREIDIDILAYDTVVMRTADLIIPHGCLPTRAFALWPFEEVAPSWRHPIEGWTAHERLADVGSLGIECLGAL